MRRLTHWVVFLSSIALVTAMLPGLARSQSGRSRPRVPTPRPGAPEPRPVIIPTAATVVKQEQVGNVSRFLLRNGIKVIISEQHAAPIAASVAWFKAGTRYEPEGSPGLARLTEQSITAAAHRPIADLRAMGSILRADTSFEASTHTIVVHSAKIKEALAAQADLLQKFSADAEQLRRVADLLIEKEKWNSSLPFDPHLIGEQETVDGLRDYQPSAHSIARLLNVASPGTGIARPLIPEKLRLITRDQVQSFYRTQYAPDKLIIVVAGDVVPFNTLVQVQQLYAGFGVQDQSPEEPDKGTVRPPRKGQSPPSTTAALPRDQAKATGAVEQPPRPASPVAETEQTKLRYARDRGDLNQSIVAIGYHVPGSESKDWAVIEVLSALAGMGRASRLHSSMVDGRMVASRVESMYLPLTNAGMLIFHMQPAGDASGVSIDKAESAFFREIDRLRREIPAEAEMNRTRALLAKRFVDRTESYAGRARELARAEAHLGGFRGALDYRTAIEAVKAADVQRMAARYLMLSNTSVHEYEPLIAPPRTFDAESFAATVLAWAPEIAEPVTTPIPPADVAVSGLAAAPGAVERSAQGQAEMESIQPLPVKDFSTLNGPRAFVREDHSVPKTTVALLFQGGRLIENETTSGTTELMLGSMLYGNLRRTGQELAQEMERLGAEVETVVEPDFFGFVLSVMPRNADLTLRFLRECVEEPAFRDDDVQRARLVQIGTIRAARDASLVRAQELLTQAFYPGTAYALPLHGREDVVSKLTSEQLRDWHARAVKRQLPLAIIVGDTNGSALISSQLAESFRRRDLDTALPVRVPGVLRPALQIELRHCEQTTVAIGLAGPKASDGAGQEAVELIKAAMNGPGGILDRELVQKNLAVMASLESDAAFAAGTIYAKIVLRPVDEQRARTALLGEIEGLGRNGLKADEVTTARAMAAGRKIITLQSQRGRALEYARAVFAQRQASEVDGFVERLSRVTEDQVKQVAVTYLKPATSSAGIVRSSVGTQQAPKED